MCETSLIVENKQTSAGIRTIRGIRGRKFEDQMWSYPRVVPIVCCVLDEFENKVSGFRIQASSQKLQCVSQVVDKSILGTNEIPIPNFFFLISSIWSRGDLRDLLIVGVAVFSLLTQLDLLFSFAL